MFVQKPPMGWNSWNTFGPDINEEVVMRSADAMVENGLLAAGYEYLVIDDCWSKRVRGADGRLEADPEKFPHGMKHVADYVHSKGLKFGMYSCAGPLTCARYPGSFDHEFVDAATFAAWGVDYLKYDYCFHPSTRRGEDLYRRMGIALANCGRDIVFSGCSWGVEDTKVWMPGTGCHLWRSTGDIHDSWASIKMIAQGQLADQIYGRPNCFNDMDMLVVGMYGKGHAALTGCTDEEYRTHFSLWAFLSSPLMIGCDIRNMSEATRAILLNPEVIAINQDGAGRMAFRIYDGNTGWNDPAQSFVLGRLMENGDIAIGLFNLADGACCQHVSTENLGLAVGTGRTLVLHDVWSGEDIVMNNEIFQCDVPAHGCRVFRAKVVEC